MWPCLEWHNIANNYIFFKFQIETMHGNVCMWMYGTTNALL